MLEKKMGNRVSKSIIFYIHSLFKGFIQKRIIVKEQRLNGSYHVDYTICLRGILTGFEINYQIIMPLSNQIYI